MQEDPTNKISEDPVDINQLRIDLEISQKKLIGLSGKLSRIEEQQKKLQRYYKEDYGKHEELKAKLDSQYTVNKTSFDNLRIFVNEQKEDFKKEWIKLAEQVNPIEHLNNLDSKYPILMMPMRIETRYKKIKNKQGELIDQLWVRVFPDDCSIDTFEALLSESEIENARDFWVEWYAAKGDESQQRAAWRILVDSHGAGRAQYIYNQYQPAEVKLIIANEETDGNNPVYLIIKCAENEIGPDDRNQLAAYWIEVWKANGKVPRTQEAYNNFNTKGGQDYKDYLIGNFIPANIDEDFSYIENRDDPNLKIAIKFMDFPSNYEEEHGIQQTTWTQAPKVKIMPERLCLLAYRDGDLKVELPGNLIPFPLICGPDPLAEDESLEEYLDADLRISPQMKWMVDFYDALANGMGFIVDNAVDEDNNILLGYDRLMVVGARLTANPDQGRQMVEELFTNHYNGNSGFGLLSVGTNTNNVQDESESGYTEEEDSDDSFEQMFLNNEFTFENEERPEYAENDRFWFNKILGFSSEFLNDTINTNGFDQVEARAMNVALWPATWGYFFETMMNPIFSDSQIDEIKNFFNEHVVGRGTIPSIRIDDQPYGILPTTVFSRIKWFDNPILHHTITTKSSQKFSFGFYKGFYAKIREIHAHWKTMAKEVSHVGQEGGDAHQVLLDVLGHHGGSVEFHNRITQGLNHIWNYYAFALAPQNGQLGNLSNIIEQFIESVSSYNDKSKGLELLLDLGYTEENIPEILEKFFSFYSPEITQLIDDQPLSEISPIRDYYLDKDEDNEEYKAKNYIYWLIRAAGNSLVELLGQDFREGSPPRTLLYIMLQHALELGYFTSGLKLYKDNEIFDEETLKKIYKEPDFIHISEEQVATELSEESISDKPIGYPFASESRYYPLAQKIEEITGSKDLSVAEFLTKQLTEQTVSDLYIKDQIEALKLLKETPTARLERVFTEHLDCASYRLDAWQWGFINMILKALRERDTGKGESAAGIYVGAYGWLENVKTEDKELEAITSFKDKKLDVTFYPNEHNPIFKDNKNYGYIQAPSLNHAVTASILRNAYKSRSSKEDAEVFAINLSSERVRKAISVLEGIQGGQNLAALLGYQFERFLHDSKKEVNYLIFDLRRQFPLAGNQMNSTRVENNNVPDDDLEADEVPIDAIEANNVIDGLELIEFVDGHIEQEGQSDYMENLQLGDATDEEKEIIREAINHIRDINDAIADLAMAESVHQLAQGNIDRAAGNMDTYSKGSYPQIPEVVQTPRSGVNITHRVGMHIPVDPYIEVKEKVLELTAEKTGYSTNMLDPDLDLEADLGIDSVKQADLFTEIREFYEIETEDNLQLEDFPTLKHIIQFVIARLPLTPRAKGEPRINTLLADLLPALNKIFCHVEIKNADIDINADPDTVTELNIEVYPVSMAMLKLQPIDLLFIINDEMDQAMTTLDDLVVNYVQSRNDIIDGIEEKLRPDTSIKISYYVRKEEFLSLDEVENTDKVSVFELIPLIKNLRALLLRSRPLKPSDVSLPEESKAQSDNNLVLDSNRLEDVIGYLGDYYSYIPETEEESGLLNTFIVGMNNLLDPEVHAFYDIPTMIDDKIKALINILRSLSLMGITNTGIGFALAWQKEQMNNLLEKYRILLGRWNKKNTDFGVLKDSYLSVDGTPEEKTDILMKARRLISTTSIPIENPDELWTWKAANFDVRMKGISDFLSENHQGLAGALNFININSLLDISEFDLSPIDIDDFLKACKLFAEDLLKKAELLKEYLQKLYKDYGKFKESLKMEASPSARVDLIQEMAKRLLSEDFKMIPAFRMPSNKKNEWISGFNHVNELLAYQKTGKENPNPLPVDDWFYGIARVREKMGHLEQAVCWAEGFKDLSMELTPIQLPYLEPYSWLAMEFGVIEGQDKEVLMKNFRENDHILYTAYYPQDFDPDEELHCGLLLDEWTEIIPTETETTGTAFHYDRPNSEPPQTMLLVTSPQFDENWKWQDLVDAVYETLDEAKIRGVEPEQIDKTGFASFLPATMACLTKEPITMSANFSNSAMTYNPIQNINHE